MKEKCIQWPSWAWNELRTVEKNSNYRNNLMRAKGGLFALAWIAFAFTKDMDEPASYYKAMAIPAVLVLLYLVITQGVLGCCRHSAYTVRRGEIEIVDAEFMVKDGSAEKREIDRAALGVSSSHADMELSPLASPASPGGKYFTFPSPEPSPRVFPSSSAEWAFGDLNDERRGQLNRAISQTRKISVGMCVSYVAAFTVALLISHSHQTRTNGFANVIEGIWIGIYALSAVMHGLRALNPAPFGDPLMFKLKP